MSSGGFDQLAAGLKAAMKDLEKTSANSDDHGWMAYSRRHPLQAIAAGMVLGLVVSQRFSTKAPSNLDKRA